MVRGKCEGGAKEGAKRLRSFICTLKGNWCEGGAKEVRSGCKEGAKGMGSCREIGAKGMRRGVKDSFEDNTKSTAKCTAM